ncbi:Bcppn1 [Botrytis cinerea B05.10]|uniref:Endopolyphosphatase n=2 Tax=Botryotinia fuckeliana TaxID=40559 RepID=A0A384JXP1_BOTFB|nr:Bcppn1 [Botrytis cinerea B05.10]ATZ55124.1 Bcppn1 [Botrytis cinerea B05.10]EMR89032.1 putative calcineurin-like phosphoesterase protein [Botrytis cinerea BcDW1]
MRFNAICIAVCLLQCSPAAVAKPLGTTQSSLQVPLEDLDTTHHQHVSSKRLHGRFLHITDLHQDPHYKVFSSTDEDDACHRGKGTAGTYGAETSDCDTPPTLIDATFKWIKENVRDNVDFVVWTGDSARHDSDEKIPRVQDEVLDTNRKIADKFLETFGDGHDLSIPVISTFGNNDILPHNILLSGPNKWLKTYTDIWDKFIPEEQRHGFQRGGWYYVEVIPKKLAVFSLNTLYFFSHNAAVDGCALRSEPGYEHMEWLRIQLQFMRDRGMKVILTGHVPPARTDSKSLWDETCWQKYTLWLQQYRDIIIGGLFGHMNIDHFMIHDTKDIDLLLFDGKSVAPPRALMDDEFTISSAGDYLDDLREDWSGLPNPKHLPIPMDTKEEELDYSESDKDPKKKKKSKKDKKRDKKKKELKKFGGPWGERFVITHVGPSIVPNYFPTLRVIEYNITGLDNLPTWSNSVVSSDEQIDWLDQEEEGQFNVDTVEDLIYIDNGDVSIEKKRKHQKDKKKFKNPTPSNPGFIIPSPPSKDAPPGPAYSPQSLTLLGYTQYFANLTYINNLELKSERSDDEIDVEKWRKGKHGGKVPKDDDPNPHAFHYQVEYDTFTDPIYKLKDMTVKSYLKLAHRIGKYKPQKGDRVKDGEILAESNVYEDDESSENDDKKRISISENETVEDAEDHDIDAEKKKKKHKKKKHHRKEKNRVWLSFVQRAFVGTLDKADIKSFDDVQEPLVAIPENGEGPHSLEL